jgi:hypothetical protein
LPSFLGSDRRGVIEQHVLFLLLGQPGEPGVERVVGWQEGLLTEERAALYTLCNVVVPDDDEIAE